MDVILKKYFWVVTLVAIALCALFAGRAASHLVEQLAFMDGGAPVAPPRRPFLPAPERVRSKDTTEIVRRNIFCSTCAPITPGPEGEKTGVVETTVQRSALPL